jgi:hypothetical protein
VQDAQAKVEKYLIKNQIKPFAQLKADYRKLQVAV